MGPVSVFQKELYDKWTAEKEFNIIQHNLTPERKFAAFLALVNFFEVLYIIHVRVCKLCLETFTRLIVFKKYSISQWVTLVCLSLHLPLS